MNNGRSLFVHRKARIARANRISADRQALLAEIRVKYADGTEEVFGTGTDWQVSEGGATGSKPTCTTARFTTPLPI